jgi:hypothetical protein
MAELKAIGLVNMYPEMDNYEDQMPMKSFRSISRLKESDLTQSIV